MKLALSAITLAGTLLLSSANSFAGTINGSSSIDFLAIDGQPAKSSFFKSNNSFSLSDNGVHQIVVRATSIVRDGSDSFLFESDPIVVTFNGTPENLVVSVPRLNSQRDVKNFKRSGQVIIKTSAGQEIATKQDLLLLEGFLPGLKVIESLSQYNASNNKASVAHFATVVVQGAEATEK